MSNRYGELLESIARNMIHNIEEILNDPNVDAKALVNYEDSSKQTPIFQAGFNQNQTISEKIIDLLLEKGADPCHEDTNKQKVLFYLATQVKDKIIKKLLQNYSFDLNRNDYMQQTPLFFAASKNHKNVAHLLIHHGANTNKIDNNGQTPIFYAAKYLEMCKLLVNRGANFQHIDNNRETPTHYAKKQKNRSIIDYFNSLKNGSQRVKQKLKSNNRFQESSPQQSKSIRKKKEKYNSSNNDYCLVYTNDQGQTHQLNGDEIQNFSAYSYQNQKIVEFLNNPYLLDSEPLQGEKKFIKSANKILATIMKYQDAIHFQEPVDYVGMNIPSYPQIVKKPMDLGTVKSKLSLNCYQSQEEFAEDVNLVFQNCITFNGPDGFFGKIANQFKNQFETLFRRQFGF